MTKQAILERVRKSLALAEQAGTAGEAQAAMLAAQRLMVKHNLSLADIPDTDKPAKTAEKRPVTDTFKQLKWWEKSLAKIIGDNFRCYGYMQANGRKARIMFLGLPEDTKLAVEVYVFAYKAIKYHADKYIKDNNLGGEASRTKKIKGDYILGFLAGLKVQLEEQVAKENWGLVLVKDAVVEQALAEMTKTNVKVNYRPSNYSHAQEQGFQDGKSLDHKRKMIG